MSIDTNKTRNEVSLVEFLATKYNIKRNRHGKGSCGIHGEDKHPSMSFTGIGERRGTLGPNRWHCHTCNRGGDIYEYVALREGLDPKRDFQRIHEIITGDVVPTGKPPERQEAAPMIADRSVDFVVPVPKELEPAWKGGSKMDNVISAKGTTWTPMPEDVYAYRDRQGRLLCYTVRFPVTPRDPSPAKAKPFRLVGSSWRMLGYLSTETTPLFNADLLDKHPDATVIVVEGEKCAKLLQNLLTAAGITRYVVVTWMGGANRVRHGDWKELWDRSVVLWPDFDHRQKDPRSGELRETREGQEAMDALADILRAHKPRKLRMVNLDVFTEETKKSGYDVADMLLLDKMPLAQVLEWMESRLEVVGMESGERRPLVQTWLPEGISLVTNLGTGGIKREDSTNSWLVLCHHPKFKGRFTYDVFDQVALVDGEPLNEAKLQNLRLEITQRTELLPKTNELQKQVEALALLHKVNRFADQLRSLVWDKTPRLAPSALNGGSRGLLIDYANCEETAINRIMGMRWMVGVVQRVMMDPNDDEGFQHDGILVLEGDQGLGKTSFFRKLGSLFGRPLYTELQGSLGRDKDDMLKLRGKCIVELAEMTAHRKSEEGAFKAFIDRKVDEYRPPYGAGMIRQPRMVAFAGTTNQQSYLTDPTGNRRIWPATVLEEIDTRMLERDLEQIWAEAVWLAQNDERNFFQGEELEWHREVLAGRDQIESWDEFLSSRDGFYEMWPKDGWTSAEIFEEWLKIPLKDRTKGAEQRLKDILTKRGYHYKQGSPTSNGQTRRWAWRIKRR